MINDLAKYIFILIYILPEFNNSNIKLIGL